MKKLAITLVLCVIFLMGSVSWGAAAVITYNDETSFLAALSGYNTVVESFEDSVWDPSRPAGTAGTITNLGLTWNASDLLRTGSGWARTGTYGVFDSEGNPDSLSAFSSDLLYGVGGWFEGYGAELAVNLDGVTAGSLTIIRPHSFFGVIDTEGFNNVSFSANDHFGADDFTFASTNTNTVPEPATMLLLGAGLIALVGARRKIKS